LFPETNNAIYSVAVMRYGVTVYAFVLYLVLPK